MMFAKVDSSPCDLYVLVTRREAGQYGEKIGRLVQERDPGAGIEEGKKTTSAGRRNAGTRIDRR